MIGFRYGLENLHQCDNRIKAKIQKVWEDNSYVFGSYRRKTGGEGLFASPLLLNLKKVKNKYGNNSRLLFTGTNNLMHEIKTEDVYEDFGNNKKNI